MDLDWILPPPPPLSQLHLALMVKCNKFNRNSSECRKTNIVRNHLGHYERKEEIRSNLNIASYKLIFWLFWMAVINALILKECFYNGKQKKTPRNSSFARKLKCFSERSSLYLPALAGDAGVEGSQMFGISPE